MEMKAHKQKRLLRRLSWEPFMRLFCFHVVVKHALPPKPRKRTRLNEECQLKNGERRFTGTSRTLTSTRHCTLDGLLVLLLSLAGLVRAGQLLKDDIWKEGT